MTISTEVFKNTYTGNGATTVFPYTFKIFEDSDLEVIRYTIADGTELVLTLTTDYTVSGAGSPSGGDVTTVATYSSAYQIIIRRDLPYTQETDFVENDPFPADAHEDALDKDVMLIQQLLELVQRAILQTSAATTNLIFPLPSAGSIIGWDATGTFLVNDPPFSSLTAVDAAATAGFLGATGGADVLRVDSSMSYTDGGDFITLGVDLLDEDGMGSDSDTQAATQQSIKAYVDAAAAAMNEFTELTDTPGAYAGGDALKLVRVNAAPDALEFVTPDYGVISAGDAATDVTGAELESLTDGSTITLHVHDYAAISGADAATDITAAELEILSDGTVTALHDHDHDGLNNYDANDHVDHTAVSILNGTGISGGGDLTADRTLSVVVNSTVQQVEVVKNSGAVVGTRKQLNFIEGTNITLTIADDAGNDQVDITIDAAGGGGGAPVGASYVVISADATLTSERILTAGTGISIVDGGAGSTVTISATLGTSVDLTSEVTGTLPVGNGGTGAATLTDGGFLLGSGTGAVTATAQPTNGQLPIGSTGVDPVLATLTAGTGINITNGAGSITITNTGPTSVGAWLFVETLSFTHVNSIATSTLPTDADRFMLVSDEWLLNSNTASGAFDVTVTPTGGSAHTVFTCSTGNQIDAMWTLEFSRTSFGGANPGWIMLQRGFSASASCVFGAVAERDTGATLPITTVTVALTAAKNMSGKFHLYKLSKD